MFWHPKGWTLFQALENYIRRVQTDAGYQEVNSPQLMDKVLWETTGHIPTYSDMIFLTQQRDEDARVYAVKPMNCPGHVQIFKNGLKSYRDLPLKIAEFGKVHRFEPSGALHGLMRVRAFTQDDAHVFITEQQIAAEVLAMNDLILAIYEDFGFPDVRIKFSDRPEKRIGDDAVWDKAEHALMQALEASGRPWTLNKGEGAFYGPKLEYVLRDAIGRDWQCGTDPGRPQPSRTARRILHRRTFQQGDACNASPCHVRLAGTLHRHPDRALSPAISHCGSRPCRRSSRPSPPMATTTRARSWRRRGRMGCASRRDLRNEKINYKVREHSLAKVPVLLVVGKKEAETRSSRSAGSAVKVRT